MFYYKPAGVCTGLHLETAELASANLCLTDSENAWMFIPKSHARKYARKVEALKKPSPLCSCSLPEHGDGGLCRSCRCELMAYHGPLTWPTHTFLHRRQIVHGYFIQRKGDIVLVGPGVPHMVLTLSPTLTESKNFLLAQMEGLNTQDNTCNCPVSINSRRKLDLSPPVSNVYGVVRKRKTKVCPYCSVQVPFSRTQALDEHIDLVHPAHSLFVCKTCNYRFKSKSSRARHERDGCRAVFQIPLRCPISLPGCSIYWSQRLLQDHLQRTHNFTLANAKATASRVVSLVNDVS